MVLPDWPCPISATLRIRSIPSCFHALTTPPDHPGAPGAPYFAFSRSPTPPPPLRLAAAAGTPRCGPGRRRRIRSARRAPCSWLAAADHPLVQRVPLQALHLHHHGLVHGVAGDHALAYLPPACSAMPVLFSSYRQPVAASRSCRMVRMRAILRAHLPDPPRVIQLLRGRLEAQVELLLPVLLQLLPQLGRRHLSKRCAFIASSPAISLAQSPGGS